MRQVEHIMGMPITVDIPYCDNKSVFNHVFGRLREIDNRFSPYKNDSELMRYQRGEIKQKDLSIEFKQVMADCKIAETDSGGYFSAYFSGLYNPTGYVKGWSVSEAGKLIEKSGYGTYCINAGGDILAKSNTDKVWNIGIQDPKDKLKIIGKISERNFAVATSGIYERGNHIVNPKTGNVAKDFLSVTVVGPNIIRADVLATAIFAAEKSGLSLVEDLKEYETLIVDINDGFSVSSGMVAKLNSGIS